MLDSVYKIFPIILDGDRPSPITPSDLSNLIIWLKADALSLAHNDPVTTWADSSGQGNNATQADAAKKPTFKSTNPGTPTGLPIVSFATDDEMTFGDLAAVDFGTGNFTVFICMKTTDPNKAVLVKDNWAATGNGLFIYTGTSTYAYGGEFTGGDANIGTADNNYRVIMAKRSGTGSGQTELRANDGSVSKFGGDSRNLSNLHPLLIGNSADGGRNINGDYAEIVVYNRDLDEREERGIFSYFASKWGVSHPAP